MYLGLMSWNQKGFCEFVNQWYFAAGYYVYPVRRGLESNHTSAIPKEFTFKSFSYSPCKWLEVHEVWNRKPQWIMSGCEVCFRNSHVHVLNLKCLLYTFSRIFQIFCLTKYLTRHKNMFQHNDVVDSCKHMFCHSTSRFPFCTSSGAVTYPLHVWFLLW